MRWHILSLPFALAAGLPGLAAAPAGTARPQATPRLSYPVESLGSGRPYALATPGANGSAFALSLAVSGMGWARWNLPRVPATPGQRGVRFYARAAAGTVTPSVRVLEEDGSEWNSAPITLGREWQLFTVPASSFRYFRSRDSRKDTPVALDRVVQIQFVLSGAPASTAFEVDEAGLDPSGRRFTFEAPEQRAPVPPSEARRARVGAVLAAFAAERKLIAAQREWARRCAGDLAWLLGERRPQETFASYAGRMRLSRRPVLWPPPATCAGAYRAQPVPDETLAAYAKKLTPAAQTLALGDPAAWRASSLYAAPAPPPPTPISEAGKMGVRLAARFTEAADQQVVFLNAPPAPPFQTFNRDLEVDLRLGAMPLDPKMPLLLRLWSHPAGQGPESWADFTPEGLEATPRGEWTTLRFPLANSYRAAAFDPGHVVALSFRLQNEPGKAAPVELAVARMELVPRDPEVIGAAAMLYEAGQGFDRERMALWSDLETLRAARERVWADPVVQRYVLRCQLRACPAKSAPTVPNPLAGVADSPAPDAGSGLEAMPAVAADGSGEVRVRWRPAVSPDGARCVGVLLDHAGRAVASAALAMANGTAEGVLQVPGPYRWSPAYPYLYRVRVALLADGKAAAVAAKEVGFRTIAAGPGDVTPLLRHAWAPAPFEAGMWLNGQPYFPNGALYHLPRGASVSDVAPLLHDLWVDALRTYGWSVKPEAWQEGDREGIGWYASLAPSYGALRDPSDVDMLFDSYGERLRAARSDLGHPSVLSWHVGNEVELAAWGADLPSVFPEAIWLPLERALQQVRAAAPPAPTTYVRAGTLRGLPVMPGEELVGVNQYTGRYGGRIEQVAAHLDLFSRWCQSAGRVLGITEWNGPQYSWAADGIGGVSERGAAYYIQRYYEAMADTPGIGLSSEFTLNWILWRVEDLTTHSHDEEWKDRPPYDQFGGGSTADHVPQVPLGKEYRASAPYRAVMAFHSPWYPLLRAPGRIVIGYVPDARADAGRLAQALSPFGKEVSQQALDGSVDLEQVDAHLVLVGGVGAAQPEPIRRLESTGWLDPTLVGFPPGDRPLVQRRVNPYFPTRGLVAVSGSTAAGRSEGVRHLAASAEALKELWSQEGAMVRAVALTDTALVPVYERLLFEFVGRGHVLGGEDTRTTLDAAEFLDAAGALRPAWWNLNALVLDAARPLAPAEVEGVRRLARAGVRVVISLPCYAANPGLQELLGAKVGAAHSLTEAVEPAPEACRPIPVNRVGQVQEAVIRRFQPGAKLDVLEVRELDAPGATPLAWTAQRRPVAVGILREKERYALLGFGIGSVAALHRRVATSGQTHRLYDRDTASGLERAGRFALNLCLQGMPQPRILPRLRGVARVEDAFLKAGAASALTVRLYDTEGRPQPGASVRARAQVAEDARPIGPLSVPVELAEVSPGVYRCPLTLGTAQAGLAVDPGSRARGGLRAVSVQIRAIRPGCVPWEGGASAWAAGM